MGFRCFHYLLTTHPIAKLEMKVRPTRFYPPRCQRNWKDRGSENVVVVAKEWLGAPPHHLYGCSVCRGDAVSDNEAGRQRIHVRVSV